MHKNRVLKCLVLGGGGFVGSAVVDRLLIDGHIVRVFERPNVTPYREFSGNEAVEWWEGDFLNIADIKLALSGIDIVIHLVSTTLPKDSNEDPIFDIETNVISTIRILDAMLELGVKRIVFISSGGTVYGPSRTTPISEEHQTCPVVSYGVTKLMIERYLLIYKQLYDLKPIILRVSNPFGERQNIKNAQGAVGVFLNQAFKNQPIEIWGDGTVTRDYIYIGDVADAFSRAITYSGDVNIFNVGSGRGTLLNDLVDYLENILEMHIERNYLPARNFDIPVSVLDIALAEKELCWKPRTSLYEGLKKTVEWHFSLSNRRLT